MRVVFRFDANDQIGHGHLMRSSVLARRLAARGHQVELLSHGIPESLQAHLQGVRLHRAQTVGEDLEILSGLNHSRDVDWLVVDHYGIDAGWETQARRAAHRILVIDDLANRLHDCDALLDQNICNPHQSAYRELLPGHCQQWLGMAHLLARASFYHDSCDERRGLLVFLGGGNHRQALNGLLQDMVPDALEPIEVLLTSAYGPVQALQPLASGRYKPVFHVDLHDTAPLCRRVAGAVIRCGFMAYELALVGTPMVIIHATPIQTEVALALQAAGYAVALSEEKLADRDSLTTALTALRELRPKPMNQIHSPGAEHVAQLMERFQ